MGDNWKQSLRSVVGGLLRSPGGRSAGPVMLAIASVPSGTAVAAWLAGGAVLTMLSELAVSRRTKLLTRQKSEALERDIRQYLVDCVDVVDMMTPEDGHVRACVMMPVPGEDALRIRYSTTGYSDEEKALLWHKGEGCVGAVLERARIVEWPKAVPKANKKLERSLTVEQRRCTSHVRMVIAVPIFQANTESADHHPEDLLAVFSLDDTIPPGNAAFMMRRVAETVATQIRDRLVQVGAP